MQICWYNTNLGTCGKVGGDGAESVRCAEECVLYSKGCEAGKRHQSSFYKTCCDSSVEGEWVRPDTRSLTTLIHEEMSAGGIEEIGSQRSLDQSQQFWHFC